MNWFRKEPTPNRGTDSGKAKTNAAISDAQLDKLIATHVRSLMMFHSDEQTEIKKCIREVAREYIDPEKASEGKVVSFLKGIHEAIMNASMRHKGFGVAFDSLDEILNLVLGFGNRPNVEFEQIKTKGIPVTMEQAINASSRVMNAVSELREEMRLKLDELKIKHNSLEEIFLYVREVTASPSAAYLMKNIELDSLVIFASTALRLMEERMNAGFRADQETIREFLAHGKANPVIISSLKEALFLVEDIERIRGNCREFLEKRVGHSARQGKTESADETKMLEVAEKILEVHKTFSKKMEELMWACGYGGLTQKDFINLVKNGKIDFDLVTYEENLSVKVGFLMRMAVHAIQKINDINDDGSYSAAVEILMDFYQGAQAKRWGVGGSHSDEEQYPEIASALTQVAEMNAMKARCEEFLKRMESRK